MHESLKVYLKDSFVGWLSHESAGDEFSVSPKLVLVRLDDMSKRIIPVASRLADECNAKFPSKIYRQILSVMQSRILRV